MKSIIFVLALLLPFQLQAAETCPRTISIGGALTEIVYKLEKEQCLIAADTTSTYPKEAEELPMIGYQRQLSAEGILSLKPDVVLHTSQAGPPSVLKQIDQAGIKRVVVEDEASLEGVYSKIRSVSKLFDVSEKGETLIETMQKEAQGVAATKTKPKVLFMMQHGGGAPMAGGKGTAADAIITLSGGENVVEFDRYKPLTPEAMAALNPDIIVTTEDSLKQLGGIEGLLATPGLKLTKAGQDKKIIAMDALLILGFGPRTIEAAQELSKAFKKDS